MPEDKINEQLSKEDVQIALEILQRDQVHTRYGFIYDFNDAIFLSIQFSILMCSLRGWIIKTSDSKFKLRIFNLDTLQ